MVTDQDIAEAMKLNVILASRRANHQDELESAGLETIARRIAKYDPSKGSSFANYCRAFLLRDHRRAYINATAGVNVPHEIADYNALTEDIARLELDALPPSTSPLTHLEAPDDLSHRDVRGALQTLQPEFSDILERFFFKEQSRGEIARALKITLPTVDARLKRASQELRALFDPDFKPIRRKITRKNYEKRRWRWQAIVELVQSKPGLTAKEITGHGHELVQLYYCIERGKVVPRKGFGKRFKTYFAR